MTNDSPGAAYRDALRAMWNEWTQINAAGPSEYYDIEAFFAGHLALDAIEREGVGEVAGKRLLHSQCHFGLTTLSWARLGAEVTGVDFSDHAIALAKTVSEQAGLPANFVCADVLRLPDALPARQQFDIVFTSYGVLTWIDDLTVWARNLADCLKPNGILFLAEEHPVANMYEDTEDGRGILMTRPYFSVSEPMRFEVQGSYANPSAQTEQKEGYAWAHPLAAVFNALLAAGLVIERFAEYDHCAWPKFRAMRKEAPSVWRLVTEGPRLPLMYSIRARKPG